MILEKLFFETFTITSKIRKIPNIRTTLTLSVVESQEN